MVSDYSGWKVGKSGDKRKVWVLLFVCLFLFPHQWCHKIASHSKGVADAGKCNRQFYGFSSSSPAGPVAVTPVTQA